MDQAIKHYMSRHPRTVLQTESVHRARQIMQASAIRHLPVMDGARVVGMVTERDIRLLESCGRGGTDILVSDAMTPDPYVVDGDTRIDEVAETMARRKFGSAIVLEDGAVAGVFTVVDAARALAELFRLHFAAPTSDRYGNVLSDVDL